MASGNPPRSLNDVMVTINARRHCEPEKVLTFFDGWAEFFEEDLVTLNHQGLKLATEYITSNFSGSRGEAQVLDVGCGPGGFPKLMSEVGFKHFVGIDGSQGMLVKAAETGLYEDLILAKLGPEPLPAEADTFDVVALLSGLQPNCMPFSVLRELCHVTKPGGLICISKTHHKVDVDLDVTVERELQCLVEEGLWSVVGIKKSDRYSKYSSFTDSGDKQDEGFNSGSVYLFRKPLK